MNTYKDAMFQLNKGYLVIGLTGYTGSGCTTSARLLRELKKPELPGYEAIKSDSPSSLEKTLFEKLNREWDRIDWNSFQIIEISKIIFMMALRESLSKKHGGDFDVLKGLLDENDSKIIRSGVDALINSEYINSANAKKIIPAYELALKKFGLYKTAIKLSLGEFILKFQNYGDNLRKYGSIKSTDDINPENLYFIPILIRKITKAYRINNKTTKFVIDAFRNPYEIEFFRKRYSEFFLVGITRESDVIDDTLRDIDKESLDQIQKRERGMLVSVKSKDNISEWVTSQDITECLRRADIFIDNKNEDTFHLKYGLIKLITLAMNPGCIPPTQDERCMQTAYVAAQMSGCISRKVGAVVLDKNNYVVGVGWNSTPHGQTPCLLRTSNQLLSGSGQDIFSNYERTIKFKDHIRSTDLPLNEPFCFRTELSLINNGKQQAEYTRALHAEENALFQATSHAGLDLSGSTLYTTASTCTLCAKKAYQLGIKRIVYVDDYPGIAIEQTIEVGTHNILNNRFEGVTSYSYLKLYIPHMPQKDLIKIYS